MKLSLTPFVIVLGLTANLSAQTLANYQATVSSQGPATYFKLDGSLASAVDPSVTLDSLGGYSPDVYRNPTNSRFFVNSTDFLRNLTTNLISGGGVTNTTSTASGSITMLFRTLDSTNVTGQRFLFSGGNATADGNALSLFMENTNVANGDPSSIKLRFGNTTTTILQATNMLPSTWYYFALTYLESRVPNKAIWYIGPAGGVLSTGMTTNADYAVAGDGSGVLYIGNQTNINSAFRNPGNGRIDEFAIWNRELSATEVSNQYANLPQPAPPGATYQQVVSSQIPKYYFKLDDSLIESVGGVLALSTNGPSGQFTNDFLGNPLWAYSFAATNDALFITNDLINGGGPTTDTAAAGKGTISFLFRMLSDTNNSGQRFLFAAPAVEVLSTDDNQLGLFLESNNPGANGNTNSLKLRVGNTTKGNVGSTDPVPVAQPENLVPNAWYYFAMTYDESRNTPEVFVYFGRVGGTLTNTTFNPANSSVVGDNGTLWIGNEKTLTSGFRNPGRGGIDEFAIWHDELTAAEIAAQFNAATGPAPTLSIALSGANVVLSWSSSTSPSYVLEATNTLHTATLATNISWPSAGTATVVGTNYVVTNALSSGNSFYRLHKP